MTSDIVPAGDADAQAPCWPVHDYGEAPFRDWAAKPASCSKSPEASLAPRHQGNITARSICEPRWRTQVAKVMAGRRTSSAATRRATWCRCARTKRIGDHGKTAAIHQPFNDGSDLPATDAESRPAPDRPVQICDHRRAGADSRQQRNDRRQAENATAFNTASAPSTSSARLRRCSSTA